MSTVAFVALGSNLAHPRRQIARAVAALTRLPRTQVVALSPNYVTAPVACDGEKRYQHESPFVHARVRDGQLRQPNEAPAK